MAATSQGSSKDQAASKKGSSRAPRLSVTTSQLGELTGILVAVGGILIFLSLVSYNPFDPSFSTAAPPGASAHNWIGVTGAYLADILVQLFGWSAFLIPFVLVGFGLSRLIGRGVKTPGSKAVGTLALGIAAAALLELYPHTPLIENTVSAGGLFGAVTAQIFLFAFNRVGAWIVLSSLLLISLFFLTTFSFAQSAVLLKKQMQPVRQWSRGWLDRLAIRRKNFLGREAGKGLSTIRFPRAAWSDPMKGDGAKGGAQRQAPPPVISHRTSPEQGKSIFDMLLPSSKTARSGPKGFKLPSAALLRPPPAAGRVNEKELKTRAVQLTRKFLEFGVTGAVTQIHPGPVVTTFEFKPEAGIKYSRITTLVEDLCLGLGAESILIERIPGKATVGIQVPNKQREVIHLRELIECREFSGSSAALSLCLGKNINGLLRTSDLVQMPHLLIAGSTGSGKSVAINSMIISLLYRHTPEELKLVLIDPKHLELSLYEGIPHLYTPIVTNPKVASTVLRRATLEMEDRLKKLAKQGVRNIEQYNRLFRKNMTLNLFDDDGESNQPLPYIVIIIDELADLMITEGRMVEESITRLAQMARAVGIHLILATQRPSVDIITGLIKANFPCRISFRVASKVDSRTVLDSNGSEALLGRGDLLFIPPGSSRLIRLHSPYVTEPEISRVVDWWKEQAPPKYEKKLLEPLKKEEMGTAGAEPSPGEAEEVRDEVYQEAVRLVLESRKASTSLLQRRLRLGYGRAARLIDMMQEDGVVGPPDGSRPREVLKPANWLREVNRQLR